MRSSHDRVAEQVRALQAAVGGTWLTVVGVGLAGVLDGVLFEAIGGVCFLTGSALVLLSVGDD